MCDSTIKRTIFSTYCLQLEDKMTKERVHIPIKNRLLEKPTEQIELSEIDRMTSQFKNEEEFLKEVVKSGIVKHTHYKVFIQRIKITKEGSQNLGRVYYPIYNSKEIHQISNQLFKSQSRDVQALFVQRVFQEMARIMPTFVELEKDSVLDQSFKKLWLEYQKKYLRANFIPSSYMMERNQILSSLIEKLSQYRIIRGFYLFKKLREGYTPSYVFLDTSEKEEPINPAFKVLEEYNIGLPGCDCWDREELLYWTDQELAAAYGRAEKVLTK